MPKKYNTICKGCGRHTTNPVYCSNRCQAEYRATQSILDGSAGWRARKTFVKARDDNTCQICKNTTWMGRVIPLIVDHIDGNSGNDNLTNLRTICPNCDAQLPTYKSKNRGNGRALRRLRYKEGKSY